MTRVLSELLGAKEPAFRLGLRQLETASGTPSEDIRLTTEVLQLIREKLHQIGLDASDTTGPELYQALQNRIKQDDQTVLELLQSSGTTPNLMLHTKRFVESLDIPKKAFCLKSSAAKKLLKKAPPKKAMKQLGYRSLDSMLKHEAVAQVYMAAVIAESANWHRTFMAQYKNLLPTDFESRSIQICAPDTKRWETVAANFVHAEKHNIFTFKELGSVVLLPLPSEVIEGSALTTLVLTMHAITDIRCTSAYLKLHQVRSDFGDTLIHVARSEPYTNATMAGERLPWRLVQQYFDRHPDAYSPELFEPHVQMEDLSIEPVEATLAKVHPRFEFWKGLSHVGLLDHGTAVSCNLTDAALNFCNKVPYEKRFVHYFRDHLWHELMLRYLHQQNLEQAVHDQLNDELIEQIDTSDLA